MRPSRRQIDTTVAALMRLGQEAALDTMLDAIDAMVTAHMGGGHWDTLENSLNAYGQRLGISGLDVLLDPIEREATCVIDVPRTWMDLAADVIDVEDPPASLAEAIVILRRAAEQLGRSIQR
jgi:hypothetical protein